MKMIRNALVVAACLTAANAANAQLGALGGLMGGNKATTGASGDIAGSVSNFVSKSAALSLLTSEAVSAINAAFSSEQQLEEKRARLASLKAITDPQELLAKTSDIYKSEQAEAQSRLDSGEIEKRIGSLSADKKKMIGNALLNFGIGSLQAVDLAKSGQAVIQSAASNPMNLPKVAPVKDALPLLSKVAGDAGGFMVGIVKLAKGANISVPTPKVDSKPADINV